MGRIIGKQSVEFENAPYIIEGASVVGPKEGEGPLGKYFDVVEQDPMLGSNAWEEAESQRWLEIWDLKFCFYSFLKLSLMTE